MFSQKDIEGYNYKDSDNRQKRNILSELQKNQKVNNSALYIRYALFFMDLMRIMRNRDSMLQLSNSLNPDGNKFEIQYMCKIGTPNLVEKSKIKDWEANTYIVQDHTPSSPQNRYSENRGNSGGSSFIRSHCYNNELENRKCKVLDMDANGEYK